MCTYHRRKPSGRGNLIPVGMEPQSDWRLAERIHPGTKKIARDLERKKGAAIRYEPHEARTTSLKKAKSCDGGGTLSSFGQSRGWNLCHICFAGES